MNLFSSTHIHHIVIYYGYNLQRSILKLRAHKRLPVKKFYAQTKFYLANVAMT